MGDIIGPDAAMLVAQFARGVSSELHTVENAITENKKNLAPVKLDRQSMIADLTGASPNSLPSLDPSVDPTTAEASILQYEAQRMAQQQERQIPYIVGTSPVPQFAPLQAHPIQQVDSSSANMMLNNIMLTLVSIERQLAMLHKLIKPTSTRHKKSNAANGK